MFDRSGSLARAMSLRQLMDRMLEDAYVMPREGGAESGGGPSMDVYEEGDDLVVEVHVPGVKPDDMEVNVERGVLTISGRTEAEQERKERNYLLREKRAGRFIRVPEGRGGQAAPHPARDRRPAGDERRAGRGRGIGGGRDGPTALLIRPMCIAKSLGPLRRALLLVLVRGAKRGVGWVAC